MSVSEIEVPYYIGRLICTQIGSDRLLGYKVNKKPSLLSFTGLAYGSKINQRKMRRPLVARRSPALANFADEVIFVTGGRNLVTRELESSLEWYLVDSDTWQTSTNNDSVAIQMTLNEPRMGHSSCSLGNRIYVYGGKGEQKG